MISHTNTSIAHNILCNPKYFILITPIISANFCYEFLKSIKRFRLAVKRSFAGNLSAFVVVDGILLSHENNFVIINEYAVMDMYAAIRIITTTNAAKTIIDIAPTASLNKSRFILL